MKIYELRCVIRITTSLRSSRLKTLTANSTRCLSIMFLLCSMFISLAAESQHVRKEHLPYNIWIEKIGNQRSVKGRLYEVRDSTIVLDITNYNESNTPTQFDYQDISVFEIKRIKLQKKGKMGRSLGKGFLYGALGGLIVWGINAAAYGGVDDFGTSGLATVVSGAIWGGVGGAMVGAIKIKIPINGNQDNFNFQRNYLKGHSHKGFHSTITNSPITTVGTHN